MSCLRKSTKSEWSVILPCEGFCSLCRAWSESSPLPLPLALTPLPLIGYHHHVSVSRNAGYQYECGAFLCVLPYIVFDIHMSWFKLVSSYHNGHPDFEAVWLKVKLYLRWVTPTCYQKTINLNPPHKIRGGWEGVAFQKWMLRGSSVSAVMLKT